MWTRLYFKFECSFSRTTMLCTNTTNKCAAIFSNSVAFSFRELYKVSRHCFDTQSNKPSAPCSGFISSSLIVPQWSETLSVCSTHVRRVLVGSSGLSALSIILSENWLGSDCLNKWIASVTDKYPLFGKICRTRLRTKRFKHGRKASIIAKSAWSITNCDIF